MKAQRQLTKAGFYSGKLDGIMGSKTQAAIKAWQQANGLAGDGYLDEKTLSKLGVVDWLEGAALPPPPQARPRPPASDLQPPANSDRAFRERARMLDNL